MTAILVTGGAGYVGSHIVRALRAQGERVVVLDDLSTGHAPAVGEATLLRGDCGDPRVLDQVFADHAIDRVVHMAASCEVGTSMTDPAGYYHNNLTKGLALLDAMRRRHVRRLVFSSTAAVYGEPERVPIDETHPKRPTNPYGETKLAFERALDWYGRAYGIASHALRYFNAAGADPQGDLGEDHARETHLIPLLIEAARGDDLTVPIFGDDYPTRDGTCIRDYVHVSDLARAHVLALEALRDGPAGLTALNLGNGDGFSVREVIETVTRVVGRRPPTRVAPRRAGDPATLVAAADRARTVLGWVPRHRGLDSIVESAWSWHRAHPEGFGDRPRSS